MKREILLYGDSRSNADILYFGGIFIPDPFFAFTLNGERCALLNPLELGRAKKHSHFDRIFDYAEIKKASSKVKDFCGALIQILQKCRKKRLLVPSAFPAFALDILRSEGFDVAVEPGEIFPERSVKKRREVAEIEKANFVAAAGFSLVEEILRESVVEAEKLHYSGRILTSEYLRAQIERASLELGADAVSTIAAAGDQACDPHECGHGPIRPRSLIVVDIFPRMRSSGYFGDMTRTFIKGIPSEAQFKMVDSVLKAQAKGLSSIKAGVLGSDVHAAVAGSLLSDGYATLREKTFWSGFFHSTGHGIGLEVHEAPSLGPLGGKLVAGNVVTVEPGLYYRGVGACRIEDNVLVQKNGARMLSEYHYNWIIE